MENVMVYLNICNGEGGALAATPSHLVARKWVNGSGEVGLSRSITPTIPGIAAGSRSIRTLIVALQPAQDCAGAGSATRLVRIQAPGTANA